MTSCYLVHCELGFVLEGDILKDIFVEFEYFVQDKI